MKYKLVFVLAALLVALAASQMSAQVLFSNGFEGLNYWSGDTSGDIDMNLSGGPNQSANGNLNGNPWWGTMPGNCVALHTNDGVLPHSGDKMACGWYGNCLNYLNMGYRANGGSPLAGSFAVDWYFYDYFGTAGSDKLYGYVADSLSVTNFTAASIPAGMDYPALANQRNFADADFAQKLSLGCSNDWAAGYDKTKYQARIKAPGATTGTYGSKGWVNLNITRSVGWHHGKIVVGAADGGFNNVSFFIDDMNNALLTTNVLGGSFNLLEIQGEMKAGTNWGYWAYYDDITISKVPEPGSFVALGVGLISLLGIRRRRS